MGSTIDSMLFSYCSSPLESLNFHGGKRFLTDMFLVERGYVDLRWNLNQKTDSVCNYV